MSFTINYRRHRSRLSTPTRLVPATEPTTQSVNSGGAAVAIRPRRTAVRRYNNAGQGEVGYF